MALSFAAARHLTLIDGLALSNYINTPNPGTPFYACVCLMENSTSYFVLAHPYIYSNDQKNPCEFQSLIDVVQFLEMNQIRRFYVDGT